MKILRQQKRTKDAETFYLAFNLGKADVRRVLSEDLDYLTDEAMTEDFWTDVLGHFLTQFGVQRKRLSIADDVGKWAFHVAINYKFLMPDIEENRYYINEKVLAKSKPGPTPEEDD